MKLWPSLSLYNILSSTAWIMLMTGTFVTSWPVSVIASDKRPGFLVACPPYWPGLDAPGAPLDKRRGYSATREFNHYFVQLREEEDGSVSSNEEMQVDCRYKGNRHLTIVIPGNDISCRETSHPHVPKVNTLVCETRGDAALAGSVIMRLAEPVTAKTSINTLMLRQTLEAIRDAGSCLGYTDTVTRTFDDGSPMEITLSKESEHIEVRFSAVSKLSRQIELIRQRAHAKDTIAYDIMMKYGMNWEYESDAGLKQRWNADGPNRWTSIDGKIALDLSGHWPNLDILRLTDLEALE
ncbi:MAG: hypothetical protein H7840_00440 [Alphaproteobacteria bacterium]